MQIPRELIPVIGSIAAAMIAGSIAFIASVFTKENKTSEFRQAWIDALRNDIAEFVSLFHYIANDIPLAARANTDTKAWLGSLKNEFIKIEQMQARIELRLNPKEHAKLVDLLRNAVHFDTNIVNDHAAVTAAAHTLISQTQEVLKTEWERVKTGEPIYFITKWVSLGVVAVGLVAAILLACGVVGVEIAP